MKLKQILEASNKMPNTLGGFNETPKLTKEEKVKLMDMVRRYNEIGQTLKMENSLIETAKSISEIAKLAETYACNEANDWFSEEVVRSDFKRARGISENFQKVSKECYGSLQKLNALFEDFGQLIGRYYEIADPMQEVLPNTMNMKSQMGLPNALGNVQEVKPNTSNIQSQRPLPANGAIKEVQVNTSNLKSQREVPHTSGPATPQIKETQVNTSNVKSQREIPHTNGPATPQVKEVSPPGFDTKHPAIVKNLKQQYGKDDPKKYATMWKIHKKIDEVSPNASNLQSQRELPQTNSANNCGCLPKPETSTIPVKPAGAGEMNVKGERDVPQGGPAPTQIKEVKPVTTNLQSQRDLPSLGAIIRMK